MTVPIEDLIRDAQERQANRAVHPDRIRAGLPARRRRVVRQRRLGLVAVCAAVAGAAAVVTVPTLALNGHHNGHDNGSAAARAGAPARATGPGTASSNPATSNRATAPNSQPTPPTIAPAALGYTVGSLPAGLIERIRWADTGSGVNPSAQTRMWSAQPVDDYGDLKNSRLLLRVEQTTGDGGASGVTPITVGGKPGWYDGIDAPDKSYVSWKPDADTLLTLEQHGLNLSRTALIGVAESVRPDPTTLAPVVTFGWLPRTFSVDHVGLSGNSNKSWRADLDLMSTAGQDGQGRSLAGPSLQVTVGTSATETGSGEPVSVRGRPGKFISDPTNSRPSLVVDLGDGTWLTLSEMYGATEAPASDRDDLVHIAEVLRIAAPDLSWMGR